MQDVYRAKLSSVDTMELKGYELIKELFVDSSGMGAADEPALIQSQFKTELTELLKKHGSLTAKITNAGQFQVYVGLFKRTGASKMHKVANNTYRINSENGFIIRLHDTDILSSQDGIITLDSGGFDTHTTKDRMNRFLPARYSVYQKDWAWYIKDSKENKTIPFKDGITLQA